MRKTASCIPVMKQNAKHTDDTIGTAFFLMYKQNTYVISTKHVVNEHNVDLGINLANRELIAFSDSEFRKMRTKWIFDSQKDIAILPFALATSMPKIMQFFVSVPNIIPITHTIGEKVALLGYAHKITSNYTSDGAPSGFPSIIMGKIKNYQNDDIIVEVDIPDNDIVEGASGGPVFYKNPVTQHPSLLGMVYMQKKKREIDFETGKITLKPLKLIKVRPLVNILNLIKSQEVKDVSANLRKPKEFRISN